MGFFDFLFKAFVKPLGCLVILIVLCVLSIIINVTEGIGSYFTGNKMETYREYIADKEYEKAHEYALNNNLDVKEVLTEQAYELMKEGDYVGAQSLCARQDQMYLYFHTLASNIQSLYEANGIESLAIAFSLIPYPSPASEYLSDDFKKQWGFEQYRYHSKGDIVLENNRSIEALGNYLKAKGTTDGFEKILEYLQPTYEDGTQNNDEVNRIKKKFENE